MSLDLMKSYGRNLTTFGIEAVRKIENSEESKNFFFFLKNYLFMIYLAESSESSSTKRIIVIGVNKLEGNTFKVIQSSSVKLKSSDTITSKTITSTNHLLTTFSNGTVILLNLNNFRDMHIRGSPTESIFAARNHLLVAKNRNVAIRNFTDFFLN